VGCLFVDIVIFLEMQRVLGTSALVSGMAAAAAVAAQLVLFLRIWGRRGPPADDSDREA